jgi:hypothetical protein
MSNDSENEELAIDWQPEESASEVFEWSSPSGKGGVYIFPRGVEVWAEQNGVELVHIDQTTGEITVQHELGTAFRKIDKALNTGAVVAVKERK